MHLNIPDGSAVADVEKAIATVADLGALLFRAAFAVNQEYVPRSTVLHDGDEVAIIPPVSGG
jgi:molybdopterin converting factor small subunit